MLDFFSKDPSKIVEKSSKLRLEGKYDKAEQLLKKNLKNSSQDFLILLELGKVQFEQNKLIEAIGSFRNAYYVKSSEISKIINVVEDIHYRAKIKKYTGLFLIELFLKKRNIEKINKIIETLSIDEIEELAKQYKKKYEEIQKSKTPESLTKKDIEIYLIAGMFLLSNKQFKEAKIPLEIVFKVFANERNFILQYYMTLTQYSYGNPDPYLAIGDLYLIMDDKDKAINYFQKATTIEPSLKEFVAKKFEESITDTENISEKSKYSLVDVYINKGDLEKSIEILKGILSEDVQNKEEVIRKIREIIQKNDSFPESYALLIKALLLNNDFEGAVINLNKLYDLSKDYNDFILQTIEKIISKNYSNNDLIILKAKVFIDTEKTEDAAILLTELYNKDKNTSFEIEEVLDKLLQKNSKNIKALSLICDIYNSRNQIPKLKTILNYIMQFEEKEYKEIAKKYYSLLFEKLPDDLEITLNYNIILIKLNEIENAKELIANSVNKNSQLFYEIIPNFYEPAYKDQDIAKGILEILKNIKKESLDEFLYEFTLSEMLYLAGDTKTSLEKTIDLLKKYPDREEHILGIVNRMKEKYPDETDISEFEFKYYITKKDFEKALEATLVLYENNNNLIGHVLDNLYLLYKNNPDSLKIMENILKVLDNMGLYEKIIEEGNSFLKKVKKEESGKIRFYLGKAYAKKSMVKEATGLIFQAFTLVPETLDDSIEILNNLLKIDFSSVEIHYSLAHAYKLNNDLDKAIEEMLEIFKLDETQVDVLIRDLLGFYDTHKSNPKLSFVLGKLYISKNEYKLALKKFNETIEISKEYIDPILNELRNLQEGEGVEDGEVLYTMGVLYIEKGLYKMAAEYLYNAITVETSLRSAIINQLQTIINNQPNDTFARQSLAQIYIDMTNYVQAIQYLRQIEMINPQEIENIISYYESMLQNDPDNILLLISLGDSNLKLSKTDEAINFYKKAVEKDKNQIPVIIDKILEFDEKDIALQFLLTELYIENNDYENAVNWLNSIYISDRTKIKDIKSLIDKILKNNPGQQNALMLLSLILYDNEEYEELIKLVYDVFEKGEEQIMKFRIGILLAQAYRKLSQNNKASEIINKMQSESKNVFYTIITQLYEEEKSKKIYKLQNQFNEDPENENIRIEYAKYLISQKNFDEARKLLIRKFNNEENEFERIYLLARISELNNNLVFALEIATPLRNSSKEIHISFLIKLLRKLGYYGEVESVMKARPEFAITLKNYNISKKIFSENKIII